jgi:transcriptional regulator with XRE-family HTH domain
MERKAARTFKTALRSIRRGQKVSLQELGLRIDSDASHIFKIEHGQDITLATMLKLADALGVPIQFGPYTIVSDPKVKRRPRRRSS